MEGKAKPEGMGTRIRMWREDQGMKTNELARRIEISRKSLSGIESGKNLPSASTLASIHRHTSLDVGYVLTGQITSGKSAGKIIRTLLLKEDDVVYHIILEKQILRKCPALYKSKKRKSQPSLNPSLSDCVTNTLGQEIFFETMD